MFIGDYKKIVFFTTPRGPLLVCLTQNQGQLPPVCVCVLPFVSLGEKKENLSGSSSPRALESCNLIFFLKTLDGVVHTHTGGVIPDGRTKVATSSQGQ